MIERNLGRREWSGDEYLQSLEEARKTEDMIRQVLALCAQGCLTYRRREQRGGRVSTKTDRLKRLRASAQPVAS